MYARLAAVALIACASLPPAQAKVDAAEAAKLGKELTSVGAIAAGNADGSIPAWIGSRQFDAAFANHAPKDFDDLREAVNALRAKNGAAFDAMMRIADAGLTPQNYAAFSKALDALIVQLPAPQRTLAEGMRQKMAPGAPLFVITRDNLAQYAAKLSEGHKALFARYPDYRMVVYPSLRAGFYPPQIEQATVRNATSATLVGTDGLEGAVLGFPFPIPKTGAEVIWNHKVRFRSSAVKRTNSQAIVKPDGSYKLSKIVEDIKFKYANLSENNPGTPIIFYYLSEVLSPARLAGQMLLVHETTGVNGSSRDAWLYNTDLGRVNRAPDVSYDHPALGSDGEQFNDQIDVFNGQLDRYDWTLIGRKEVFIPYDSLAMLSPFFQYKDIVRPGHINQNLARYELHRVWVVEATLKAGLRHQFAKRRFYVDEDGWAIAAVDCYDKQGQLWKVQEAHLLSLPFLPSVSGLPEIIYDLQSGRYFMTTLVNEDRIVDYRVQYKDEAFTPNALTRRSQGR